jgi:hypothetical protein
VILGGCVLHKESFIRLEQQWSKMLSAYLAVLDRGDQRDRRNYGTLKNMKPVPAPNIPGNTEAEHMSNALSMVLTARKRNY